MRLTLAGLLLCLAIYCGGGFANNGQGNVVLSLPPSLIAAAAAAAGEAEAAMALRRPAWKKDARVLFDSDSGGGNDALRDMLAQTKDAAAKYKQEEREQEQEEEARDAGLDVEQPRDFNRKAAGSSSEPYDLVARQQSAPQEIAPRHGAAAATGVGVGGVKYATPTLQKYWSSRCQAAGGNCPREYNRAMLAVRNREALARLHQQLHTMQDRYNIDDYDAEGGEDSAGDAGDSNEDLHLKSNNNEVFMLLTGEQDLVKFLHWAMQLLYPHTQHAAGPSGADFYHPSMFIWKKLNFSGHLEPPLIVDEPRYILVRREQNSKDDYKLGDDLKIPNDPFIPPRGRKHNIPDLDALLNRYETFVPNRGKRDKVKDLFKYDDLFFPNRGKKEHRDIFKLNDPFFPHRGKKLQLRDLYNVDDPFFPNRGKRQSMLGEKEERKLQQQQTGDRMSTHEINRNDQSVKPSMSSMELQEEDAAAATRWQRLQLQQQLLLPANRLHSTRSMSAMPRQRQQVKRQIDARETQLTRSTGTGNGPDTATATASHSHKAGIDTDYGQLDM